MKIYQFVPMRPSRALGDGPMSRGCEVATEDDRPQPLHAFVDCCAPATAFRDGTSSRWAQMSDLGLGGSGPNRSMRGL